MNIFYLDKDPTKAAQLQYNKHVVKMILESAQMLCTVHRYFGNEDVPYKSTHLNHPSTVWARKNNRNYMWLYQHMMALGDEYTKRYNKKHLTITKCEDVLSKSPSLLKDALYGDPIDMPQCMPDEYKDKCSVKAYWNYYIGEKHTVANPKTEKIYDKRRTKETATISGKTTRATNLFIDSDTDRSTEQMRRLIYDMYYADEISVEIAERLLDKLTQIRDKKRSRY